MRFPNGGLTALALLSSAVALTSCEPRDRRPGLWLSGEVVTAPVSDWSFTDDVQEIFVETRTWYVVPHSVTTVCASLGDALYVPSVYFEGGEFPDARFWNRNVMRDPRVRLKIGEQIFPARAVLVEDPAERDAAMAAFARKFPFWRELSAKPEQERPVIVFFRIDPRDEALQRG